MSDAFAPGVDRKNVGVAPHAFAGRAVRPGGPKPRDPSKLRRFLQALAILPNSGDSSGPRRSFRTPAIPPKLGELAIVDRALRTP